jgi:hypothetical protein
MTSRRRAVHALDLEAAADRLDVANAAVDSFETVGVGFEVRHRLAVVRHDVGLAEDADGSARLVDHGRAEALVDEEGDGFLNVSSALSDTRLGS